ncbi:sirohydrochlorin cobaltochelatase [Desulfospira joergensenii]|uniref:sirohydrochlorin cobaltochelatase n=1 Tax=Desulfospira joergensenii TaxID=53329 RepID=UPI000426EE79|nr:sirohydrochlorin cobaltochelatase [Desulfospira joergensenii]
MCNGKMKKIVLFACILGLALCYGGSVFAGHHGKEKPVKKGILLVAFGSSEESAQVSFKNIEKKTKAAFPEIPVKWAYTSHIIRHKLARQGIHLDSAEVALAKMADEGFTHVVVQSLHTIGGAEYHDLIRVVAGFKTMGAFESIILGNPLLATQEDMERAVSALLSTIPKERKKGEAVVFMGHGTHHPANAFYAALMLQVQLKDPNVFIGTVEGYPALEDIEALLKAKKIKTTWLIPFMSVAGDHAKNDMAGDEEDSWKSILTQAGFKCKPVLKGTAEYDAFVDIWVDHIRGPLGHF